MIAAMPKPQSADYKTRGSGFVSRFRSAPSTPVVRPGRTNDPRPMALGSFRVFTSKLRDSISKLGSFSLVSRFCFDNGATPVVRPGRTNVPRPMALGSFRVFTSKLRDRHLQNWVRFVHFAFPTPVHPPHARRVWVRSAFPLRGAATGPHTGFVSRFVPNRNAGRPSRKTSDPRPADLGSFRVFTSRSATGSQTGFVSFISRFLLAPKQTRLGILRRPGRAKFGRHQAGRNHRGNG